MRISDGSSDVCSSDLVSGAGGRDRTTTRRVQNPQHPYTKKLMAAVPVADPSYRHRQHSLLVDEIPSVLRHVSDKPLVRPLVEVGEGHFVARHAVGVY